MTKIQLSSVWAKSFFSTLSYKCISSPPSYVLSLFKCFSPVPHIPFTLLSLFFPMVIFPIFYIFFFLYFSLVPHSVQFSSFLLVQISTRRIGVEGRSLLMFCSLFWIMCTSLFVVGAQKIAALVPIIVYLLCSCSLFSHFYLFFLLLVIFVFL